MGSISLMSTAVSWPWITLSLRLHQRGLWSRAALFSVCFIPLTEGPAQHSLLERCDPGPRGMGDGEMFLRKGYRHAMTDVNQLGSLTLPCWNVLGGVETIFRNVSSLFLRGATTDSHSFLRGRFKGWNTLPIVEGPFSPNLCVNSFVQSPPPLVPSSPA